ncbi:hypothetical protein [Bacillus changyiensis]|uniref:hypothetical protein n=1 Tax=Bacillus changyiensis TaxID=3004103 RepID=UPI0022E30FD8|nr:hypothetical protein [Bacillus changyiensis]MDA1477497.1 hypothetical protein [Bacillus changyiensis]
MCSNSFILADYFKENFPIKQMRHGMYDEEDIYYQIPKLVFRFEENADQKNYVELKKCIESFKGNLEWTLFQSFIAKKVKNYVIAPKKIFEMQKQLFEQNRRSTEKDYFTEEEYRFLCEKGIEDIPDLTKHIKSVFKFQNEN